MNGNGTLLVQMLKLTGSLILVSLLLYSCQKNPEKNTGADTVAVSPVTVDYVADSMAESGGRNWDDTIKPIKKVYILPGSGAAVLYEMDGNSGNGTILPFAQELGVLAEYPEWYKVRSYYNGQNYTFYILKKETVGESPAAIRLLYPNFEVYLKGFSASGMDYTEGGSADTTQSIYNFEEEGYDGPPAWVVRMDTLEIYENFDTYALPNRIRISAKNKTDQFRVSYAYMQHSYEQFDQRNERRTNEEQRQDYTAFFTLTPYILATDSSGYYTLPREYSDSECKQHEAEYKQAFKKKFQLRDTSVIIPFEGDYGTEEIQVPFTWKKRLFSYSVGGSLYIRIERISGGKVKEVRYLMISQEEGC